MDWGELQHHELQASVFWQSGSGRARKGGASLPRPPAVLGPWGSGSRSTCQRHSIDSVGVGPNRSRRRRVRVDVQHLAVDETVILLHPPLHLVGVSVVMERGRQQLLRFSAAKGVFELGWRHHHGHPRALPLRLFADVGVHARHLSCSGCVHGLFHGQRCASTKILRDTEAFSFLVKIIARLARRPWGSEGSKYYPGVKPVSRDASGSYSRHKGP